MGAVCNSAQAEPTPPGRVTAVAAPTDAAGALAAVSCRSAEACVAVGNSAATTGYFTALAESWNGRAWKAERTPTPAHAIDASLLGISCPAVDFCMAVGTYSFSGSDLEHALAEVWNGKAWRRGRTPSDPSSLSAVSCATAQTCVAVGDTGRTTSDTTTLAESWKGTRWSVMATPELPPNLGAVNDLSAVSCPTVTSCVAVGHRAGRLSRPPMALAEAWNGKIWVIKSTPVPTDAALSFLRGVSCSSPKACIAVGVYGDVVGDLGFAEKYNGRTWTVKRTVNRLGATTGVLLSAVSCPARGCIATGAVGSWTLAQKWDAGKWVVQTTANPEGAGEAQLAAVSCSLPNACLAVGGYVASSGASLTLAEVWNGSTWSLPVAG
jgi:hypothetical protein